MDSRIVPPLITTGISVSTTIYNKNTGQVIPSYSSSFILNSNAYMVFKLSCSLSNNDNVPKNIKLIFRQTSSVSADCYHLYISSASGLYIPTDLHIFKYLSNNIYAYECDLTDILSTNFVGDHYFALVVDNNSSMSFYTQYATDGLKPYCTFDTNNKSIYSNVDEKKIDYNLNKGLLSCSLFSGSLSFNLPLFDYKDELIIFSLSLNYLSDRHDTNYFVNSLKPTYFPIGWKLNYQLFIYLDNNNYIYYDENFLKHTFSLMENSTDTYFDTNGSYLILKIVSNVPIIYLSNGDTYSFNSEGYISEINLRKGNVVSSILFNYDSSNKKLMSISYGNQVLVSLNYLSNSIEIALYNDSTHRKVTINSNSNNCLSSITNLDYGNYSFLYENNKYLISISYGRFSLEMLYDTSYRIITINNKEDSVYLDSASITYFKRTTKLNKKAYNNSYLANDYLYFFNSDGSLSKEATFDNGDIISSKAYIDKDRLKYDFDNYELDSNLEIIKDNNDNELDLENSYINVPYTIYVTVKEDILSILYFEVRQFYITQTSLVDDLLTITIYKETELETIFIKQENIVLNVFDTRIPVYIPLIKNDSEDYISGSEYKIVFSHSNSNVSIKIDKVYVSAFNKQINYFSNTFYTSYQSNFVVSHDNNPFNFNNSYNISINVNGQNRNLKIYKEDYFAHFLFELLGSNHYLFYNKGKNCIKISSAYYVSSGLKYMHMHDYTYYLNGYSYKNFGQIYYFSNVGITSLRLNYSSGSVQGLYKKIEKYDYTFSNGKNSDETYDIYLNKISETDELNIVTTYEYSSNKAHLTKNYSNYDNICYLIGEYVYTNDDKFLYEKLIYDSMFVGMYSYNNYGLMTSYSFNGYEETFYQYDYKNNLNYIHKDDGQSTLHSNTITYNNEGISSVYNMSSSNTISYTYSTQSKTTNWNSLSFTKTRTIENNLIKEEITSIDGDTTINIYDKYNRLLSTSITHSDNSSIHLSYDYENMKMGGKLLNIHDIDNNKNILEYEYDLCGNVSKISEGTKVADISNFCDTLDNSYCTNSHFHGNGNDSRDEKIYSYGGGTNLGGMITTFADDNYVDVNKSYSIAYLSSKEIYETIHTVNNTNEYYYYFFNNHLTNYNSTYGVTSFPFIERSYFTFGNGPTSYGVITYLYESYSGALKRITSASSYYNFDYQYSRSADTSELTGEVNSYFGNISYSYNSLGNITSIIRTNTSNPSLNKAVIISYGSNNIINTISINGYNKPTTYNSRGYPSLYKNNSVAYKGNYMMSYGNTTFTYDKLDRRKTKILNTNNLYKTTNHTYFGNKLLKDVVTFLAPAYDQYILQYIYDEKDELVGFYYNNNFYIYHKDILGNIVAIYLNGTMVCKYIYDAYGNHVILDSSNNIITSYSHIGTINPFRYRGYYYDVETGLYYLNYRYYDSEIGRFISPDTFEYIKEKEINGTNLFCYCLNDPIKNIDKDGHFSLGAFFAALIVWITIRDICLIALGVVSAEKSEKGHGVKITNSHKIVTPWMRFAYSFYLKHFNAETSTIINGSSLGVSFEWLCHNAAYIGMKTINWVLTKLNKEEFFDNDVISQASTVNVGHFIFSDKHGGKSLAMFLSYLSLPLIPNKIFRIFSSISILYDYFMLRSNNKGNEN